MKKYFLPTKIFFGEKTLQRLPAELQEAKVKKPLLICGKHFLGSGKYRWVEENLGYFEVFSDVEPNPGTGSVDAAARFMNEKGCDAVIGIGGGSVLDTAKVVACMKGMKGKVEFFYGKNKMKIPEKNRVPFFALPTTAGSGSEVTMFSILTLPSGVKKSLHCKDFYARTAIVDPELTYTCPPETTASSGIDAFCQAIEAYWARNSTSETDKFAAEAIPLAYGSLVKAVKDPDRHVRMQMSLASLLAGQAFSQTGTTACHTLSYAFTRYYGLVHGFSVAITLPWFLEFYAGKEEKKCLDICSFIGAKTIADGKEKILGLMRAIGAPTRLFDIGCPRSGFPKIIEMSFSHKPQNPRRHSRVDLEKLLDDIY